MTTVEIRPGARCRIAAGPLVGYIGTLDEIRERVAVLRVTILGDSTPVEIPREFLEVVAEK